ncbi:MAG: DEAD/DEAH box helicase [Phycisphaeraceae bacterium]|nr:MAG: DEAD/DEAH box helicase [Phycisphaeraceae bacterium]
MTFNDLRLIEPIVRAVADEGYTIPTPIQGRAIPEALAGRDVLGTAQTGTGKTCAFALPILQRLTESAANAGGRGGQHGRAPRALILCPTRELAMQIMDSFVAYGRHLPLRHAVVFGGINQARQVRALRSGVDVLVATPGRLLDLINQGYIDLSKIETLVLDEADRMLDMGFIPDIRRIVGMIPTKRQTLLFSATVSTEIRRLANALLTDPVLVETTPESTTVELITQRVYMVDRKNKPALLEHMLRQDKVGRTLVFTRTKHGADKVTKHLRRAGVNAEAIHGNKSQNARMRTMAGFRSGVTRVLVATDIASRGIDVDEITHVVNFDMPVDAETYVHRVGRTARAGASGVAISFCDRDEIKGLRDIERRTRIQIEVADDAPELVYQAPATTPQDDRPTRRPQRPSFGGQGSNRNRPRNKRSGGAFAGGRANNPRGNRGPRSAGSGAGGGRR